MKPYRHISRRARARLRQARRSHSAASPRFRHLEALEPRLLLSSVLPGIDPIDPSPGEANLLRIIDGLPLNDIQNALDHFPIPYVVWAQKAGHDPVVTNNRAGSPTRVDVDDSHSTGKGGHDVIVEVNTMLFPTPHLELSIDRIGEVGKGNFVDDFSVLIGFPFDAFTNEVLPGASNLFFGYETTGADGGPGGIAPFSEVISFTPGTLGGTEHLFDVTLETAGDSNPLRFFSGHFDGDIDAGVLNFDGLSAWVEEVPDTINIGLDVAENALFTSEMFTSFGLEWTATNASRVEFGFVENESTPGGGANDYGTTLIVDQMPTWELLSIALDESNPTLTLSHRADAVVDELAFQKTRDDGLIIRGVATDIPTEVDLTYEFDPTVTLDVNANTLDLHIEVIREGGIPGTDQFFGYDLGYASVSVVDAPDLTATWDPDFDQFSIAATNPGEYIGLVELVLDDDAHFGAVIDGEIDMNADGLVDADDDGTFAGLAVIDGRLDVDGDDDVDADDDGTAAGSIVVLNGLLDVDDSGIVDVDDDQAALLVGLATAPSYFEGLDGAPGELHHIFSLVDDGTHGTAIGRVLQVVAGTLDLDADASEAFHLELAAPSRPLQAYLRTATTSTIVPGHDIEITCDIDTVPYGVFDVHFDGPGNFGYTTDPPQTIESIHCFGHIDTLNFDIDAGNLPPVFDFEFAPDSHVTVFAGDGLGGPADIGHIAARFWDVDGPVGLPNTAGLLGASLRDARMRVDQIPSSHAEWTQVQTLAYDNGSGDVPSVGHVLYDATSDSTAEILEAGGAAANGTMKIGFIETATAIGDNDSLDLLDSLAVDAQTEDFPLGAVLTGETSGATATVRRARQIGGAGVLYVSDVAGVFQNNENLLVDGEIIAQADGTLLAAPTWAGQVNGALVGDGTVMDFDTDAVDDFLGGVQLLVSTEAELETPLPVADLSAPHFVLLEEEIVDTELVQRLGGGAFGIDAFHLDTFSSLNVHYDANESHLLLVDILREFGGAFFGPGADFQYDLSMAVDAVPQQFDLSSDLMTQFVYEASAPITSVTLAGTVDDTDDATANGTEVTFGMLGLPSEVRFGILTSELVIVNGRLDVNGNGAVGGADDGMLAGADFLDGRVDMDGDGDVDGDDDGRFFGITVINGEFDVDASGTVDGDDDGGLAGAELSMNGGVNQVGFGLESNASIFESDYRLIQVLVDDVPAQFVLSYGDDRFVLETRDAVGNPDPLGEITAQISTTNNVDDNNAKVLPFTLDGPVQGGPILADPAITAGDPGGSRINYTPFLQEIDERYYNGGVPDPSGVLIRLAELYADSEQLDTGEDHLLVRMEDPNTTGSDDTMGFAAFQFNSFQHLSWTPDADGGRFIYRAPGRGDEPFFAGYETDEEFTTLQIEHIPDEIDVDLDETEHLTYTASASPGEIDVYQGPGDGVTGLFAGDGDDAIRAIIRNTPDEVRVFWDFGFPNGGAFMDASNEFEILFLTQDGGSRITAGLTLEDLHVGWGIDLFSFDVTDDITIWNPFGDDLVIPIAWEIFEAKAGIDNDADGLTLGDLQNINEIGANGGKADVAGFFSYYENVAGPQAINGAPGGSAPAGQEYTPVVSIMTEGFREFSMDFLVELDPTNPGADLWPIDLEFHINTTNIGNLTFDFWSSEHTEFTDDDDIPFIPEVGFINPPDYTDNTPFHILPGLFEDFLGNGLAGIHTHHAWVITFDGWHTFNEHFDPFAGTPAPFTGSSGGGGGPSVDDTTFLIDTIGPFAGALDRWNSAGVAESTLQDVADNTTIAIGDFAGTILGDASGNSGGATIQIDPDAGGFDWFVDATPFADEEFTLGGPPPADLIADGGSPADGNVDMLTFFEHEIGHILFGTDHATLGLMQDTLPRGVRRLPTADDATPGAPPPVAPAGDDIAALRVGDEPASVPDVPASWVNGYVQREDGSERRRNALAFVGSHTGALGISALGATLNETRFDDIWTGPVGRTVDVLRTTLAADLRQLDEDQISTEDLLPFDVIEHANPNGLSGFGEAERRSLDGESGSSDAGYEPSEVRSGRSDALSSEFSADIVADDVIEDRERLAV